jgi:hypothetical protein
VLYCGAIAAGVGRREVTAITATTAAMLGSWVVVSGSLARRCVPLGGGGEGTLVPRGTRWHPDLASAGHSDPAHLSYPGRARYPRASPYGTRCGSWGCCS